MIAPRCIICGKWSEEAGGFFVQFNVTDPKEIEHNEELSESFKTGKFMCSHPKGNWFFCGDHTGLALRYKHLTWNEAEPLIRKDFENGVISKVPVINKFLDKIFKLVSKN